MLGEAKRALETFAQRPSASATSDGCRKARVVGRSGQATTGPYHVLACNERRTRIYEVIPMQSTILVSLDGSPLVEHTLTYAERWPK
jgi:hypothetical protein